MKKTIIILALVLSLLPLGAIYHKIGDFTTTGCINSVVVEGDIAYVAAWNLGLAIIDVSNPQNPTLLGQTNQPYDFTNIAVNGDVAYLLNNSGIQFFDISNPQNPIGIGSYIINNPSCLTVSNNIAYVVNNEDYLLLIDVSNPLNPILLGSCAVPNTIAITISDNVVYAVSVIGFESYLSAIDVTNPQNPFQIGAYNTGCAVKSVAVAGNIAYLVHGDYVYQDNSGGLKCIDVSNPQNMVQIGSYETPMISANSICVEDNIAYVTVVDFVYNSALYAIDGLQSIDVSDPQNPALIGYYALPPGGFYYNYVANAHQQSVTVIGNKAYVAEYGAGLQIIDVANPQNPAIIGSYASQPYAFNVEVSGNNAYVIDGHITIGLQYVVYEQSLSLVDVTNLQNPSQIGAYDSLYRVKGFTVQDNLAYIAIGPPPYEGSRWYDGLKIVDISNPQNPTLLYSSEYSATYAVAVVDSLAYVAISLDEYNSGIGILDVSNPQDPVQVGLYQTSGTARSIAVSNSFAYMTLSGYPSNVFEIIDVTNPLNPSLLSTWNTPGDAYKVVVNGSIVYLADGSSGLQVINVADPASPTLVSTILPHATSNINLCYIHDNLLYISDVNWNEISVYDITVPLSPVFISRYAWNLSTVDMCVSGGRMFTANEEGGLNIHNLIAVANDDETQIPVFSFALSNYPNPFNPETTISYTLPAKGQVCLEIFNSKGQLVKRLLNESQPKGKHSLTWNGKDNNGNNVASGLYLCRITSTGKHESRKMLLLK
jgi:hypothetical protein